MQKIVISEKRETPFKEGRPDDKWYSSFRKRHPNLTLREPEALTKSRAIITEEYIRKWFRELNDFIAEHNLQEVVKDPRRVLNGDETSFSMCPKTGKVLAPKWCKNVYDLKKSSEKETITVLRVFSAAGETVHPMVVFPSVRPPASVVKSMPENWYLGRSDTSWMKSEIFYEYVVNWVNSWITENDISRPVILFVDGHKSRMSLHLSIWCDENEIILHALPANTTHIMQPADVSVFKPLKSQWKKKVREWQSKHNIDNILTKNTFSPLLAEVLKMPSLPSAIIKGFERCGLFPLNPDSVDYTKCIQNKLETNAKPNVPKTIPAEEVEKTEVFLRKIKEELLLEGVDADIVIRGIQNLFQNQTHVPDNTLIPLGTFLYFYKFIPFQSFFFLWFC